MNSRYFPVLDAFRGIAILLVVISHMGLGNIIPGGFGVTLFFFISGFLITRILIYEYDTQKTIDLKNFYLRRLFRLYPALILMLIISCTIILLIKCHIPIAGMFSGLLYFTNYYLAYFRPGIQCDSDRIFDILWSLSIEEHFYLFFPFLFSLFYKRSNNLVWILSLIIVSALSIRLYLLNTSENLEDATNVIYHSTHTRADAIVFGCLSALVIYKHESKIYINFLKTKISILLGVSLILFSLLFRDAFFRESLRYSLQGIALALVVPAVMLLPDNSRVRKLFENKAIIFIGKLSYSLYLFHWVSMIMAMSFYEKFSAHWFSVFIPTAVTLSLLSYFFVEKPFVSLRQKFGSNVK